MIPLFKALVADDAVAHVADAIHPDPDGRVWVGEGPTVKRFEAAIRRTYGGGGDWLATNSCTSALYLALQSVGVGPGDCVVSTPLTCSLTNSAVVLRGARPIWADVDPRTGNIDPTDVALKVSWRNRHPSEGPPVRAIVAVDFAGRRCDYDTVRVAVEATGQRCPPIVEDAAHLGPEPLSENRGDWVALSFQGIKFLNTTDGGALLAPPEHLARARRLRWAGLDRDAPGWRASQDISEPGGKWHMTDVAASFGLANLPRAKEALARHRENAAYYDGALRGLPGVVQPPWDPGCSWWLYVLLADDPSGLISHLADRGVEASPVHRRNDAHSGFHYPGGPLPGVDKFAPRQVAIPVGWWLTEEDRRHVAEAVVGWARR